MIPRPRIVLPLWAALTLVGVAYMIRAVTIRSGDFTPELPGDLIVGGVLLAAVLLVGVARHGSTRHADCDSQTQHNDDGDAPGHQREHSSL